MNKSVYPKVNNILNNRYSTPVIDKKPVITENTNPTAKPPTHPAPSNVETQLLPLTKSEAPAIGELFKVTVTMVCSPHNFKVNQYIYIFRLKLFQMNTLSLQCSVGSAPTT